MCQTCMHEIKKTKKREGRTGYPMIKYYGVAQEQPGVEAELRNGVTIGREESV